MKKRFWKKKLFLCMAFGLICHDSALADQWLDVTRMYDSYMCGSVECLEHLYTTFWAEKTDWESDGVKFVVNNTQLNGDMAPLYRLFKNGEKHLRLLATTDQEKDAAIAGGYVLESTLGYIHKYAGDDRIGLYRVYNDYIGNRFYGTETNTTMLVNERGYSWENSGNPVGYVYEEAPADICNPPTASFSASPTSGDSSLRVIFDNNSTAGTGTSLTYSWDFGDGGTSTSFEPSHNYYNSTGNSKYFTPSLTVTNECGENNTFNRSNYIIVNASCPDVTANFSVSDVAPEEGEAITFTDDSSGGGEDVDTWSWTFGDGTSSSSQNPSHSYTDAGIYTVELISESRCNSTDSYTTTITVEEPETPVEYNWEESNCSSCVPYECGYCRITCDVDCVATPGGVVADGNCSGTKPSTTEVQSNTSMCEDPEASIDGISPSPADEGETVSFTGFGHDSDGGAVSYSWSSSLDGFLSNGAFFSKSNLSVGVHVITLTVTDDENDTANDQQSLTVVEKEEPENEIPTVGISSHSNGQVLESFSISLGGTTIDADGVVNLVNVQLNQDPWQAAVLNASSWTINLSLEEGLNDINVQARDDDDEWSDEISISLEYEKPEEALNSNMFEEPANRYDIPSNLLRAIAYEESHWGDLPDLNTGYGLMQLELDTPNIDKYLPIVKDDYGYESVEALRVMAKLRTPEGMEANLRIAACKLRYDVDDVDYLLDDNEPLEALESWWWVLVYYNGGGLDKKLETSNYPYRVYNHFLDGVKQPGTDLVRVSKIPITFPPFFYFKKLNGVEIGNDEVNSKDHLLVPSSPPNDVRKRLPEEDDNRFGFIRVTHPFNACEDLGYLHDNDGKLLDLKNFPNCEENKFKFYFPMKHYTSIEKAPINSVYDYSSPVLDADWLNTVKDGYVIAFSGEFGQKDYGSATNIAAYKNATRSMFHLGEYNYKGGGDTNTLSYDKHNGYDYRTWVRTLTDGTEVDDKEIVSSAGVLQVPNPLDSTGTFYVEHKNNFRTKFLHCAEIVNNVNGRSVKEGEDVCIAGAKGTGSIHAHIEFQKKIMGSWISIDPYGWHGNDKTEVNGKIYDDGWTRAINSDLWGGMGDISGVGGGDDPDTPETPISTNPDITVTQPQNTNMGFLPGVMLLLDGED